MIHTLLRHHADASFIASDGSTAYHKLFGIFLFGAAPSMINCHFSLLKDILIMLRFNGADVNARDHEGHTALDLIYLNNLPMSLAKVMMRIGSSNRRTAFP